MTQLAFNFGKKLAGKLDMRVLREMVENAQYDDILRYLDDKVPKDMVARIAGKLDEFRGTPAGRAVNGRRGRTEIPSGPPIYVPPTSTRYPRLGAKNPLELERARRAESALQYQKALEQQARAGRIRGRTATAQGRHPIETPSTVNLPGAEYGPHLPIPEFSKVPGRHYLGSLSPRGYIDDAGIEGADLLAGWNPTGIGRRLAGLAGVGALGYGAHSLISPEQEITKRMVDLGWEGDEESSGYYRHLATPGAAARMEALGTLEQRMKQVPQYGKSGTPDTSAPIILDSPDPDKIPDDELPKEVKQVVEGITGKEDIGEVPSWLRPVLSGLGGYAGYKRGGLTGALLGGAGGYGISELLQRNPGIYEWIRKNPQFALAGGLIGADALGLGSSGGSSDNPYYQPYSPLTYENLGGSAPSTEMPQMAQGGIAGSGSSGLNSLRTGLRDAIINSIDDPNRQGVNSFVPSMLKAYDEIPKLQAGGISGGANPGFVDPGKQAVRQQQSQPGFNQAAAGSYGLGSVDPSRMGLTTGIGNQMRRASSLHQGGVGSSGTNISGITSQGYNPKADTTGVNPITNTSGASNGPGPGAGSGTVPGIGSGYDPMTAAIGQNILEQRAAMGGLGSNMTDISLARGLAPHMAGLQNQWFNQQMGMQGFNQRERENMARFGLQQAALENQGGMLPYASSYFRSGGVV